MPEIGARKANSLEPSGFVAAALDSSNWAKRASAALSRTSAVASTVRASSNLFAGAAPVFTRRSARSRSLRASCKAREVSLFSSSRDEESLGALVGGSRLASTWPCVTRSPMTGRREATSLPLNGTVTSASPPDLATTSAGTRRLVRRSRAATVAVAKSRLHCCSLRKGTRSANAEAWSSGAAVFVACTTTLLNS